MLGWPDWKLCIPALEALLQVELLYSILTLKEAPHFVKTGLGRLEIIQFICVESSTLIIKAQNVVKVSKHFAIVCTPLSCSSCPVFSPEGSSG